MQAYSTPLAEFLKRNRLQQKDVAAALGVSRMAVLAWVHGRSVPSGANLLRLVEYAQRFEAHLQADDLLDTSAVVA